MCSSHEAVPFPVTRIPTIASPHPGYRARRQGTGVIGDTGELDRQAGAGNARGFANTEGERPVDRIRWTGYGRAAAGSDYEAKQEEKRPHAEGQAEVAPRPTSRAQQETDAPPVWRPIDWTRTRHLDDKSADIRAAAEAETAECGTVRRAGEFFVHRAAPSANAISSIGSWRP